ncbi:TonB family protein [Gemmatimonas aurantiaca]|nr:TonB family protein [Gemmatimonas aurantiaca]
MTSLGLNSKALTISLVIHGMMAAGFMITHPFGAPNRPEFEIISVGISAPAQKQAQKVKQAPPPPPEKEEQAKPKTQKKPEPPKEKIQPSLDKKSEPQIKKTPPKKEKKDTEPEYEYSETPSYAEGGYKESAESSESSFSEEFSNAEFSGSFDSPGFAYPDWNYRGFEKIARAWNNRAFSTRALFCKIHFFVLKSGRVHSIEIEESSGNPVYDRGCKQAVKRAAPLPPLPRNFAHEEVGISLIFPYKP